MTKMNVKEAALICSIAILWFAIIGYMVLVSTSEPSPTETITIGEFGDTIITRTQSEGCNNDLRCIDKEIYTGIIIEVDSDKIVFEDGCVVMAEGIDWFVYKIGSKYAIEMDIYMADFGYCGRIVSGVTILN